MPIKTLHEITPKILKNYNDIVQIFSHATQNSPTTSGITPKNNKLNFK